TTQQGLGLSSETDATGILPHVDIKPIFATDGAGNNLVPLGRSGNIGKDAFIPASYYTYGLGSMFGLQGVTLGLALNAPFALRTNPNPLWAGLYYSRESEVLTISANPTVAVKINDWLSIGAGAQIQYFRVKLFSAFPASGSFPPFGA